MKQKFIIVIGILIVGNAQLNAQAEFIDQLGIGGLYGFVDEKENSGFYFNLDYLMGAHIHHWNTAILAGIRFNIGGTYGHLDAGAQVEHFFGYFGSRNITGFGASLAGGVQILDIDNVIPYFRVGGFWHFCTMIKLGLELDYRLNEQLSAGIILTVPSATFLTRLKNFERIYVAQ